MPVEQARQPEAAGKKRKKKTWKHRRCALEQSTLKADLPVNCLDICPCTLLVGQVAWPRQKRLYKATRYATGPLEARVQPCETLPNAHHMVKPIKQHHQAATVSSFSTAAVAGCAMRWWHKQLPLRLLHLLLLSHLRLIGRVFFTQGPRDKNSVLVLAHYMPPLRGNTCLQETNVLTT
ncbi:hypothetical protein TraAM80_04808 [Trypanosoma rangeli]|uniref:Uncharacterized protein n=1 Tax=Trypanosoma rangeli TaxID=5698 RepID=A0A422NHL3_TRYRA|nr:uncharacterized protein TraAM80_04808 [Trypanosoma rangeli]RNF04955.1 hypothetical protein TraAM80_04808 [Trypanosoma rangeli]|eukprot:RNF04955.1 hypothetical protein TraAM80_04808 [Trypanosoma rangeli]